MPGIYGIIDISGATHSTDRHGHYLKKLAAMTKAMRYEPFYISKEYVNADFGVYVGWVGTGQSDNPDVEIRGRRDRLIAFASGPHEGWAVSDREDDGSDQRLLKLLGSYVEDGGLYPDKIENLVSGCLIDERSQRVLLFNDRYGMERLFVYRDQDQYVFSSEAKAILASMPETRCFDIDGVGEYLSCGCTLGERSLYRGIRVLPGGTEVRFERGNAIQTRQYFSSPMWEVERPIEKDKFVLRYAERLKAVLAGYATLSSGMAVSLTGGIDSRIVMAALNQCSGPVQCYTFGSKYRDSFDVIAARSVSELCGQPHSVIALGDDFLTDFPAYFDRAVMISDGYIGFSGAAELYLNQRAREIAPSRVTGNYGGELLRGVRAFKSSIPKGEFYSPELRFSIDKAPKTFHSLCKMNPASFTLFVQVPAGYGRYAIERSQLQILSPFLDYELVTLIYRMRAAGSLPDFSISIINECRPVLLTIPTDRGILGTGNRMHRAARHAYHVVMAKAEYWSGHGMPDRLAYLSRIGLDRSLEKMFIGRNKFQHFRPWSRIDMSNYIREVLLQRGADLGGLFIKSRIEQMVHDHLGGRKNYLEEIDKIMTLTFAYRNILKGFAH